MLSDTWNKKLWLVVISGLSLGLASTVLRYWAFAQTEFATGWDGYYYLVQLKSLEESGEMHAPEGSLIYPYLHVLYWFTGNYMASLKWGSAILCGCWTILLYGLPRARNMGLLLAAWSVFSPHLSYFAAEYPKNLLGMVLFVAMIAAMDREGKHKWLLVFSLLILNYFGHRMTFGLAVVYLLSSLFFQMKKPILWKGPNLLIALATFLLILLAGFLIPGLAQVVDLQRLSGTIACWPQFAPWSFISTFELEKITWFWLFELGMVLVLLATIFVQAIRRIPKWKMDYALLLICLLLLFPFLKWSLLGFSWRFFLVVVLLIPLLLRTARQHNVYRYAIPILLLGSFFSWKSFMPGNHDPDYGMYSRLSQNVEKYFETGLKPELVIAHNAWAEYFTFSTGIDAMPWLPEYHIDSTRLWRVATGVRLETLRYYADTSAVESIVSLGSGYMLMPEWVWQKACTRAAFEGDDYFMAAANTWRNPSRMRPAWLLRKRK